MGVSSPSRVCSLNVLLEGAALFSLVTASLEGFMDFPDRLILSPRVMAGICVGSCVITCLSPFSPLTRLPDPQALSNLAPGCRLLVSRGLESADAISLQPHIFCDCELKRFSGSWPLGTGKHGHTVWLSSQAPFW